MLQAWSLGIKLGLNCPRAWPRLAKRIEDARTFMVDKMLGLRLLYRTVRATGYLDCPEKWRKRVFNDSEMYLFCLAVALHVLTSLLLRVHAVFPPKLIALSSIHARTSTPADFVRERPILSNFWYVSLLADSFRVFSWLNHLLKHFDSTFSFVISVLESNLGHLFPLIQEIVLINSLPVRH